MIDAATVLPTTLPVVILLLILASLVAVLAQRLRFPYTVGLVVVGVALDALGLVPPTALSPGVVLWLLLPPLLFEAAFTLRWSQIARVGLSMTVLATIGVVLSAGVTAGVLAELGGVSWPLAWIFGGLVAATDPVTVVAFFRQARVSASLRALVEGESLLNDGTAVVLVTVLGQWLLGGQLNAPMAALDFLRVAVGGLVVGCLVGGLASLLARGTSDYLIEATVSVAAAYGSYLIGQDLQVSGVLAVVGAGSVFGNFGRRFGISEQTEEEIDLLWRFLAFVANSLVFLLLGSAFVPGAVAYLGPIILVGVAATLLGRAVVAYGFGALLGALTGLPPLSWRHVLFWGGLRGALPVVVSIAVTAEYALAPQLSDLVLAVVVATLLLQGTTIEPLLERIFAPDNRSIDRRSATDVVDHDLVS